MHTLPVPVVSPATATLAPPRPASHDAELIRMWLHGRPENTCKPYRRHVGRFLARTQKPLSQITVGDLQGFSDSLAHLAPRSRNQAHS